MDIEYKPKIVLVMRSFLDYRVPVFEKLSELLIRSFTYPGDIVLDLFCGTGTACVAAKRLGRNYIGCDIDPDMVKIANRRLKEI